jgi:putative membrane protein
MMWGYGMSWGMIWISLVGLILLALLGLAIWLVVRWMNRSTPDPTGPVTPPSALEILRQRYARGELPPETFEAMRARLEAPPTPEEQALRI